MAINLRRRVERDLSFSLEGAWGLPVILIAPDGETIDTSENSGTQLKGQVLFDTIQVNPDTGDDMVVGNPIVTLRRSSLSRIPQPGENWIVKIPPEANSENPTEDYVLTSTRAPEGGKSIGIIRLYLRKAVQI